MSDADLVARLKDHDDDAYREVLERYTDPLYRYIYGITGDSQLSQDILGDTFLRMVEKIASYTYYGAPFKAWLYRIAHNLAINALKQARFTVGVTDLDQVARPITDPAIRVAARLEEEDLRAALRAALPELTEDQQQVLLLRFVEGQSPGEVAQTLGGVILAIRGNQTVSNRPSATAPTALAASSTVPAAVVQVSPFPHAANVTPQQQPGSIQGAPTTALAQLRALLEDGKADGRVGKDSDALITQLDNAQQALASGNTQAAAEHLQAMQRQLLAGAHAGTIAPAFVRQALTGITVVAQTAGITVPLRVANQ